MRMPTMQAKVTGATAQTAATKPDPWGGPALHEHEAAPSTSPAYAPTAPVGLHPDFHDVDKAVANANATLLSVRLTGLAHSMNDTNSRAFIQQLDAIDDPQLRANVRQQFEAQNGESLEGFIRRNDKWNNNRDNRDRDAALQLISPDRDKAETEIANLPKEQRDAMKTDAMKSATELENAAYTHDTGDANAQKMAAALGTKSAAEIELLREAVRTSTAGHKNLYQSIDDGMKGGNEDEAIALTSGSRIVAARAVIANETEPHRLREVLGHLTAEERARIDPSLAEKALKHIKNPADRAEITEAFGGKDAKARADAMHVGNLLKPRREGSVLDAGHKENFDRRDPKNVMKELEAMSGAEVKAAAEQWKEMHPFGPSMDKMIEEQFGDDKDKTDMRRLQAMIAGNKGLERSLHLQAALRDNDQKEIEAALAHDANDPSAGLEQVQFEAANLVADQQQHEAMNLLLHGGGAATGRTTQEQLDAHFDARAKDKVATIHTAKDPVQQRGDELRQEAHDRKVRENRAASEDLLGQGKLSPALEYLRADGDEEKDAALHRNTTNEQLDANAARYAQITGHDMLEQSKHRGKLTATELDIDNYARSGVPEELRPEDAAILNDEKYRHVRTRSLEMHEASRAGGGTLALDRDRQAAERAMVLDPQVGVDAPIIERQQFGTVKVSDNPNDISDDDLAAKAAAVHRQVLHAPNDGLADGVTRDEFNRQDAATNATHGAELEAKKSIAEGDSKVFDMVGKAVGMLPLPPEATFAIDAALGVAEIAQTHGDMGKDFEWAPALEKLGVTLAADAVGIAGHHLGKPDAKVVDKEVAEMMQAEKDAVKGPVSAEQEIRFKERVEANLGRPGELATEAAKEMIEDVGGGVVEGKSLDETGGEFGRGMMMPFGKVPYGDGIQKLMEPVADQLRLMKALMTLKIKGAP